MAQEQPKQLDSNYPKHILQEAFSRRYREGINRHLTRRIEAKLQEVREQLPTPDQVAIIAGFNPHGNPSTREFFANQLGEYDPQSAYQTPQLSSNDIQGLAIPWGYTNRKQGIKSFGESEQRNLHIAQQVKELFDYYEKEFQAADMYSGSQESIEVFTIVFNYLRSHERLDTIMAHSTGAKALISFLDVIATYVYGTHSKNIPEAIQRHLDDMSRAGLNFQSFLFDLFSHIKVIQFVRGNTNLDDITNMHPKLRDILILNDVSIVNYYHPKDYILTSAQLHNRLKRFFGKNHHDQYQPIGKTRIPSYLEGGEKLAISNIQLQEGGIDGHNDAIFDVATVGRMLEDRSYLINKKSS